MSKAMELKGYRGSGENLKNLHISLKETIHGYLKTIEEFIEDLSEEDIEELAAYFDYFRGKHDNENFSKSVSIDKIKILFLLFCKLSGDYDADRILSYLESVEFGWHDDTYYLNNSCLRYISNKDQYHCKRVYEMTNIESATNELENVHKIFFSNKFSPIMLFVFSYCLASLFSSILNEGGFSIPFFLQIAVDKESIAYQVLKEVAQICDVNSGFIEKCDMEYPSHRQCGYSNQFYYPEQSVTKNIDALTSNFKDSPILIIGHENEQYYTTLLREVANIPTKKKPLDLRGKFNLLPVFICPEIKSSFDNVFDVDLREMEVSNEYLALIRNAKQTLASWVLKLITDMNNSQSQQKKKSDMRRSARFYSFFTSSINRYVNRVCQEYSNLTLDNARNVGFLNFFFTRYLNVFRELCTFYKDEKFECFIDHNKTLHQSKHQVIDMLTKRSEKSLARLHDRYRPMPTETGIEDKDAKNLAKQIEKHYRKLKVYIRVIPSEVKEDRYIFTIDTLNETKDVDVSRNSQTVQRRLKKYEYFRLNLSDHKSIKLIVSERPLADNSLVQILNNTNFAESKLKIPYAMGFDDTGAMCIEDMAEFPHLLLGGATRSGKSTAIMSLLMSIAYKHRTGEINVMILDLLGKEKSDFDMFNGQRFLAAPVITDADVARKAILLLREEKVRRLQVKNLSEMPYIVCVIDEFSKLYSGNAGKEYVEQVKDAVNELLSSGRHAKIHLVLALQNPTKEDVKGSIANITARIAMKCAHYQYSKTILGRAGAEKLVGKGQMIFDLNSERDKILQGSYISPKDIKVLLSEIDRNFEQRNKNPFILKGLDENSTSNEPEGNAFETTRILRDKSDDDILLEVIMWSLPQERIANSRLQAKCQIGNNRANRVLNRMEEMELIRRLHGNLGWKTIPRCFEDLSLEVVNFLKENGVTEVEIRNILNENSEKVKKNNQ